MLRITSFLLVCTLLIAISYSEEIQFSIFNSTMTFTQLPPEGPMPPRSSETDNYWCAVSRHLHSELYGDLKSMGVKIKCYGKYPGGYVYQMNIGDNFKECVW